MRKTTAWLLILLVAAGCAKSGEMAATPAAKSYTILLIVKPGETFNYKLGVAPESGDASQSMVMDTTMTVDKVENDQTTMRLNFNNITMGGQQPPQAALDMVKKIKLISVMDKHGKTISTRTEGAPGGAAPAQQYDSGGYPEHPIKVGDTWTSTSSVGSVSNKLVNVESKGGKEIAYIEATPSDATNNKIVGSLKMWIDVSNGMVEKMEMIGPSPTGNRTVTMERV